MNWAVKNRRVSAEEMGGEAMIGNGPEIQMLYKQSQSQRTEERPAVRQQAWSMWLFLFS